jgi:nitrile hydratase subunit alpha
MDTTRRRFLAGAATVVSTAATGDVAHDEEHVHQDVPSDMVLRVKSIESLLVEKGLIDRAAIDAIVDIYENKVGPRNGARVVARAWVDSAYKQRLLANGTAAIAELGYSGEQGQDITVVENTPKVHNLIPTRLPQSQQKSRRAG